jgi:hypothetical protein
MPPASGFPAVLLNGCGLVFGGANLALTSAAILRIASAASGSTTRSVGGGASARAMAAFALMSRVSARVGVRKANSFKRPGFGMNSLSGSAT